MNKLAEQIDSVFVKPRTRMFNSLEDLRKHKDEDEIWSFLDRCKETSIEVLFDNRLSLLIGEPGFGKTYLLQRIVRLAEVQKSKGAIFAALRSFIPGDTIETIVTRQSDQLDAIKTASFKLQNSNNIIVCLDGLDEIRQDLFSEAVERIKEFLGKYRNISLILSCRLAYYRKCPVFEGKEFKIIKLYPFTLENAREYLQKGNIDKEKVESIFKKLEFQNRPLIIQVPRYLSLLVEYINSNPDVDLSQISRSELFEYFIYKKLEKEDKVVLGQEKRSLIKRVLEKLALVMEIYQTNEISKDELMTFFDDTRSNLASVLLNQISIDTFYNKSLIRDNIHSVSFENPEFQEYLASKEILRLGRIEKTLYDIVVDRELQEIHPSWFNTLSFLLEQKPDLFDKMLDFELGRMKLVIDDEYTKLLLKVDPEKVDRETRRAMFKEILTHYQEREELWLDWEIAEGLSPFYDDTLSTFLKSWIDGRRKNKSRLFIRRGNIARLVNFLLTNPNLRSDDRQYWRRKLIVFANDTNENGVLQRRALFALRQFKGSLLIKKVENTWKHRQELVRREFLKFCYVVDPNCKLSIEYFAQGMKENFVEARYGICEISTKKGIKKFLEYLKNDSVFFHHFIDHESVFKDKDNKIIENIKSILDEEITELVFGVLMGAFESKYSYDAEKSTFIRNLACLLKDYDGDFLIKLISKIKKSKKLHVFDFKNVFAAILDKDQVKTFIDRLQEIRHGKAVALGTLQQIKFSDREGREEIYEEGRKWLGEKYEESERFWQEQERAPSEETRLYKEFQDKLERLRDEIHKESNRYHFRVLADYLNIKDRIKIKITDKDRNDLKDIIIFVFETFDPRDAYAIFRINTRNAGTTNITWHTWTPVFANCMRLAFSLKIDISKYRRKIINFIPFAEYEDAEAILRLINNVKPEEARNVAAMYKSSSDLRRFHPESFVKFVKQHKLKQYVPIIKEFIEEETLSISYRKEALRVTESLNPSKNFLEEIFNQRKKDEDESFQLAEIANELLIEDYKDAKTIRWRFTQLKERIFKLGESMEVHSVGFPEYELDEKKFAASLMRLKDIVYMNQFLDLLEFSFKKVSENRLYWTYVQYLWRIVVQYFENLKYARSYDPLKQLESFLQNQSDSDYSNWFKDELKRLKRSYANYIGKPTSITDAIKAFNAVKSRQYLAIATSEELCDAVMRVINEDLKNWIESKGGGKILRKKGEKEVQPILQIALENKLLKRGFDFEIYREPQLLDSKRVDFLINYRFIGQILLELKLSSHPDLRGRDLESKKSFRRLQQYMKGFSVKYGILFIVDNTEVDDDRLRKIKSSYSKIDNLKLSEPLKLHEMN